MIVVPRASNGNARLSSPVITQSNTASKKGVSSDEQQIRELVARWHAASRDGDVDTVLTLMTDDVVFLVAGRPPMNKTEFAALSRGAAGHPAPALDSSFEIREIHVAGDLAYLWAQLAVTVLPPQGPPVERAGHTLTILRRTNGRWQIARDANLLTVVKRSGSTS